MDFLSTCPMDWLNTEGQWLLKALFTICPFKPFVESSSLSTLIDPHSWGVFLFKPPVYGYPSLAIFHFLFQQSLDIR
jgi:hypothetical protein